MAKIPEPEYECGDAVEVLIDGVWWSAIIADGWYQQTFDEMAWIYAASSLPGVPSSFYYLRRAGPELRRA